MLHVSALWSRAWYRIHAPYQQRHTGSGHPTARVPEPVTALPQQTRPGSLDHLGICARLGGLHELT